MVAGAGMERTLELRWFFRGEPEAAVARWLDTAGAVVVPSRRVDRYLWIPDGDLGIKTRGPEDGATGLPPGGVEIKGRVARLAPAEAAAGRVCGHLEEWVKWSPLGLAALAPIEGHSLPVEKRRRMAVYDLTTRGRAAVELTTVRVGAGDDRFWTVGVEAFGRPRDPPLEAEVRGFVAGMFEGYPGRLPLRDSLSYAEWLARQRP